MSSNKGNVDQPADISNLEESFSAQQKKISALKELVRKSEVAHGKSTSSAQEKVKNIAQRLTHLKSKARSRQSLDVSQPDAMTEAETETEASVSAFMQLSIDSPTMSNVSTPTSTPLKPQQPQEQHPSRSLSTTAPPLTVTTGTPSSEKILLLRQQMEQNKMRMAQRASSKLHLEQLVTQLKEKFGSTQQLCLDASDLGKSMNDLSVADAVYAASVAKTSRERHKSATDLSLQPFSLERERMKFLENRCRLLEKQLEKERQGNTAQQLPLNESTSSQATTIRIKELETKILELEETLEERQKNQLVELESLRQENDLKESEMSELRLKLKECAVADAADHNAADDYDSNTLKNENEHLQKRIAELEEINDILETTRFDLAGKNSQNEEQLQQLQAQLNSANEQLRQTEAKCASLQELVENLQNSTEAIIVAPSSLASSDTESKITAEMAKQIQQLLEESQTLREENSQLRESLSENDKLEVSDNSVAEKIAALEATIESQRDDGKQQLLALRKREEELMEKTIELNVLNANFKVLEEKLQATSKNKSLFSTSGSADDAANPELQAKVLQLKQKLDESNKATIKLKLKCKQAEKQMEKLRKSSDLHSEVVRLERTNEELQQKVIELEDEKGQWQLTQVEDNVKSSGDGLQRQTETIRLLEQQKYEQTERLETALQELQALQQQQQQSKDSEATARVKSEMSEIQLEEQLGEQLQQLTSLRKQILARDTEVKELHQRLQELHTQRDTADKKLELYISENNELLDKVEKLSKSSSSAESIEIVERLTQQERAEIEAYNKRLEPNQHIAATAANSVSELTQTEMGQELSESLVQLREESSELMNKIELFTTERREVLEKMENLTAENHELIRKIEELDAQKKLAETHVLLSDGSKSKLEVELRQLTKEKDRLALQVAESSAQKAKLSQELTSLQHSSEVVASLDCSEGAAATLFDKCEKSLTKLNSELETYRKANDKNAKFNASKKLAKEAKNAHAQLSELLVKVKESSTAVETVTVVETVVAVTAPNGKALAEYEQLTAQNRELKVTVSELRRQLQEERENNTDDDGPEPTTDLSDLPAIAQDSVAAVTNEEHLIEALEKINKYEEQCCDLQSTVENLRQQLQEVNTAGEEKSERISLLDDELAALRKISDDFDLLINEKEMSFEKQIEQLTRLRRELEGKCETYEGEIEILQTLVTEQKQQLIEAYKESEHEINVKLLDLQQRDEQITELRTEISALKAMSTTVGEGLTNDLQKECDKLHESLKINKTLVAEQENELGNKQETIDTLNQQIIDLYKAMEENANKIIEKEDEMTYLQELLDTNNTELERLRKDNEEQKSVVDKLLNELHSHRTNIQHLPKLESELQRTEQAKSELEALNKELETRNKSQLDKLKKYAANLKKRSTQCQELEAKIHEFEKGALEAQHSKESKEDTDANNLQLNERIVELQVKLKEVESSSSALNDSFQAKTVELLETMERNALLESDLKITQDRLVQVTQESVQLQNALAASSQDQISDWGDVTVSDDSITKELSEKVTLIAQLEEDLKRAQESEFLKSQEIVELQTRLNSIQDSASKWEDASLEEVNNKNIIQELAEKTASLEKSEQALCDVQAELLQMHEYQKIWQQAEAELGATLAQSNKLTEDLQKQLANMNDGQNTTLKLQDKVQAQEQRLAEISEELRLKALKFEKSKAVIKERNNQIQRLQATINDLHQKLSSQPEEEEHVEPAITQTQLDAHVAALPPLLEEHNVLKTAYEKLNEKYNTEKSNFQETIARLETLHNGIQAKLQEDMSYIETLELENNKYKDKICRLEECVACFEERRSSMERRANLLDAQMQTRADEYEKTEDELIYRLNMLSDHDDVIAKRLLNSQEEKEELQDRLDRQQIELKNLNSKYSKLEIDYQAYQDNVAANVETELYTLREKLKASDAELQRLRSVFDAKLAAKTTEVDDLECELSDQLEKINAEKRSVFEELERSRDECAVQKDEIVRLKESQNALEQAKHELERESTWLRMQNDNSQQDQYEAQELRMQTMQDKAEIENLRHQIETLAANHEIELHALRTQISELDTLRMQVGQNQTDDQVFIETENKRLTDLLAEKETVIDNYQRQNLQLQMAAVAATAAQPQHHSAHADPIALAFGLAPPPQTASSQTSNDEIEHRLQHDLAEKTEIAYRLQHDLSSLKNEFQSLLEGNREMQRQLLEKNREIENLKVRLLPSQAVSDVIPAPPMFFASEQMTLSPFDEIVQMRSVEHILEGAAVSRGGHGNYQDNSMSVEQPTIEDLQRNVSDLEKHAQDLENKLAVRNQREGEYEERLRETQARMQDAENRVRQQVELQKQLQLELQKQVQQSEVKDQHQAPSQRLEELSRQLAVTSQQLQERDEQWRDFESKNNVQHLKTLLEQRENEITQLKHALEEEKRLKQTVSALENQIITSPNTQGRTENPIETIIPTLDMFFGNSSAPAFDNLIIPQISKEPVVEELIVPKRSYDCQPKERAENTTTLTTLDLGDDWDDNDTWDSKEAAAEAAHFASTSASTHGMNRQSLVTRERQLEIQLQDESERIQELQLSLERCEQQKTELQVKSGKMMKKLKEYKTKVDDLNASINANVFRKSASVESNSMFGDLDAAIQEELKTQIKKLEAKLEEEHKLQGNYVIEKEKLLKRIDVLTAGNDRMSEMKERQDLDMQMYQVRIRELQEKLNRLDDWGAEGEEHEEAVTKGATTKMEVPPLTSPKEQQPLSESVKQQLEQRILQLTAELDDVNGDRQELQALLDDEKSNVTRAEETMRNLHLQISVAATSENSEKSKYNELKLEMQNLQELYNSLLDTNGKVNADLKSAKTEYERKLQTQESSLNTELQTAKAEVLALQVQVQSLRQEAIASEEQCNELQTKILALKTKNHELIQATEELQLGSAAVAANQQVSFTQNEQWCLEKESFVKQISDLKLEIERLESISSLQAASEQIDSDLLAQLQEKESEIMHLKQRIEDLMHEDQTEKLVLEILTKNQEIHMLKMQVKHLEDDKHELQHNLSVQITKEMQLDKNDVQTTQNIQLQGQVQRLESLVAELQEEKTNMEEELKVLNNHVLNSLQLEDHLKATSLELDVKNIEISELKKSLEASKINSETVTVKTSANNASDIDFEALNARWELTVEQKCGEIAQMWREHLEQRERDFKITELRLHEQIEALQVESNDGTTNVQKQQQQQQQGISAETTATSTPASESTVDSASGSSSPSKTGGTPLRTRIINEENEDEADAIIEKMQTALESQEMEIVTLKEQLAIRSAEYARLAAQYDPFKLQTTLSHSGHSGGGSGSLSLDSSSTSMRRNASTGDASVVPKSELDLALYMLHQRDMRCEEVTLELVSLLEERDTLQLKLSNTLRQVEANRIQSNCAEPAATHADTTATTLSADSPIKTTVAGSTGGQESADDLTQKLSQLHTVKHSRDKVIMEEREQRNRQMEKIQQDCANIPQAAVSELVGTDLSQSSQSPSSVLLNWLWGNKPNTGPEPN